MQTVGFPASIMAGELINAGLWPPVDQQIWKDDLAWQPIPFGIIYLIFLQASSFYFFLFLNVFRLFLEYLEIDEDTVLLGTRCSNFEHDTQKVIKDFYKLNETHKALLQHIKENGNLNVENPIDVLMLRLALDNSVSSNFYVSKTKTLQAHKKSTPY